MEKAIGKITHYFPKIGVAVVKLDEDLRAGDTVSIKGKTTNFIQSVCSMQMEHKSIDIAKAGTEVGMKVESAVERGDMVYREC